MSTFRICGPSKSGSVIIGWKWPLVNSAFVDTACFERSSDFGVNTMSGRTILALACSRRMWK